jgi:hypothetical protein
MFVFYLLLNDGPNQDLHFKSEQILGFLHCSNLEVSTQVVPRMSCMYIHILHRIQRVSQNTTMWYT